MYWTKVFIPTLRDDPAESQSATHRMLIRAGYLRGRDELFLGRRSLRKIETIARAHLDAVGGQEVRITRSFRDVAAELRSYRQLPQIWYQFDSRSLRAAAFDLSEDAYLKLSGAIRGILAGSGAEEPGGEPERFDDPAGDFSLEEFHTPGQKSIADITSFTGLPPTSQMKSFVMNADGEIVLALVRGDHQIDEERLRWFLDARELRPAKAEEIREAFGADAGSLGPIGVKTRVVADLALRGRRNLICGANRNDYHLKNVTPGKDFFPQFHPIRDDSRPEIVRTKFGASALQVSKDSAELVTMTEGVCEIRLDRLFEAAVKFDADGLMLAPAIAPFGAVVTPVNFADEAQRSAALDLHDSAPFDILLDDRDERPGVKFKDADLIGIPYRITLGKKLAQGVVEIRDRRAKTTEDVPLAGALAYVAERIK